jgi:hypothetical protein
MSMVQSAGRHLPRERLRRLAKPEDVATRIADP